VSDWDNPSEYGELFLQANANAEYISAKFADVLRDMMRAFAADDPAVAAGRAATNLSMMFQLIQRSPEPVSAYLLCMSAAEDLQENWPDHTQQEDPWAIAARSGLKMLVEQSCFDNAARGRASKRRDAFGRDVGALGRRLRRYLEE
jgi:hypothetical protein